MNNVPYKTHVLIKYYDMNRMVHQAYVPVRTQDGSKTQDWIDMWCMDHKIESPVYLLEDSIGRKQHLRVK